MADLYQKDPLGIGFCVLLVAGGLFGFLKAGSVASLVASSTFAGLTGFGIRRLQTTGKHDVVLAATGLLAVIMGRRFAAGGKFMPPGLIALLSLASFVRYGLQALNK